MCRAFMVAVVVFGSGVVESNAQDEPMPWGFNVRGYLNAWGKDGGVGLCDVPAGDDFIAVAAGSNHVAAIRRNGSLACWGVPSACDVPPGNDFVGLASSSGWSVALRSNGSLAAWGGNRLGQCNVAGGYNFTAVAAGYDFGVAIRENGSLAAWPDISWGHVHLPGGNDYVAVAAGTHHGVALKADGSLVGWGFKTAEDTDVPPGKDFVDVAAGGLASVAIREDGSLVGWDNNSMGDDDAPLHLISVPSGNDFVDIAAGNSHVLALRSDGSLAARGYGSNLTHLNFGQWDVPEGNDFAGIAAGRYSSFAIADPFTLVSCASGNWGETPTWGDGTVVPTEDYETVVGNHVIDVAADCAAETLLVNEIGGQVAIDPDGALVVGDRVELTAETIRVDGVLDTGLVEVAGTLHIAPTYMESGTLSVAPAGIVNVDNDCAMKDGSVLACELGMSNNGSLVAGSSVKLEPGCRLELSAVDSLGDLAAGEWGDKVRTIVSASGPNGIAGTFTWAPTVGDYLGHGVWLGNTAGEGLSYNSHAVDSHLFQAALGDIDGDRHVDFDDVWGMLTAGKYNTGDPAVWTDGEFTGDGLVDFGDVWELLTGGNYNQGDYTTKGYGQVAVPEPSVFGLLVMGVVGLLAYAWRRRRAV